MKYPKFLTKSTVNLKSDPIYTHIIDNQTNNNNIQ